MTIDDVIAVIRDCCAANGSQRAFARTVGVSAAHVSQVLLKHRPPGPKLLRALNLEEDGMRYRRKKR